jgi:HSP20 family protein
MQSQTHAIERSERKASPVREAQQLPVVTPAVDVYENAEELLVIADFPGVTASSLAVHLDGAELTVEGRREDRMLRRVFQVPSSVDPDRVRAEISAGVLRVHLGKRETAKPRRIEVQAK